MRKPIDGKHLGNMMMLPAKQGTCEQCAVDHNPDHPHDATSLFYQYHFYNQNGRWPTWVDAWAHCANESVIDHWQRNLTEMGIDWEKGQLRP